MGTGKSMGFAAWVRQVQAWCQICQPMETPYPSGVTHRFQPPVPTFACTSGCVLHCLSCTSNLKVSLLFSPLPISHSLSPPSLLPSRASHLEPALTCTLSHPT